MLIHTGLEGPRDSQIITEIRTAGGWRYSVVYCMPLRMLSTNRILRPLIGCRPQMVGSAEQTSHIRRDARVCQAVVAAPVTGSLIHIKNTAGTVFSPQKRTYGGTDQIKGTVFQVWLQIIAVGCNMDAATSVLPWDATEAVVDVSVAGPYRHVARCQLQLAQLWRCPVPWCTIWKGTSQYLMSHIVLGHKVPGETKRACLQKLFPPWTCHMRTVCRISIA